MTERRQSIEAELIRYRIEKRMRGRRDLLLHFLAATGIVAYVLLNGLNARLVEDTVIWVLLWSIPLALHGLRYYYRSGRGAVKRADEIEEAIDDQGAALDEDEALLIEERVSQRIAARRIVVAHLLASLMLVATLGAVEFFDWNGPYQTVYVGSIAQILSIVFVLHAMRFFLVHGKTVAGRALKIEAEVEREWHLARQRSQARRSAYESAESESEAPLFELGEIQGRRMRLTAEGEFDAAFLADERETREARR